MATATKSKQQFAWQGFDTQGNKASGNIEAVNMDIAKALLKRQGVKQARVKKSNGKSASSGGKIESADVTIFARQLTTMLGAGVPLVQSFEIVGEGHENKAMRQILLGVKNDLEGGAQLSQALKSHPQAFDDLFCSLVEAGEQSGTLEKLLNEIAIFKEKSESLKRKIKKAVKYPISVLIVAGIVTSILLVFVVPSFESLFESTGGELPAFTQMVVSLSEWFQKYWYMVFGGVFATVFGFKYAVKSSRAFKYKVDKFALGLPIIGDIVEKSTIARFARTLSTMSNAGMPLVEAMVSVSNTSSNLVYKDAILKMKDQAESGTRLGETMIKSGLFPNMVLQMVAIGEESGSLDSMLAKVAEYYEEEVDAAVDGLTSMMEPLIMSFLGVLIGGLVVAMYLPIFKMGDAF